MATHHTKDKGDLGVAKAFADLVGEGFTVLFPATEHAPFDLVTHRAGRFSRIQVEYRTMSRGGVSVRFRSVWNDRHGTHMRPADEAELDTWCIYRSDTDECYYVRPSAHEVSVTFRVAPPLNGQRVGVRMASKFREVPM